MSINLIPVPMLFRVAQRFKLLSEPSRLELLNQLQVNGEMCVSDLVKATAQRQANVSKNLNMMAREGILERRKAGVTVYYSIVDPSIQGICLLVCSQIDSDELADNQTSHQAVS